MSQTTSHILMIRPAAFNYNAETSINNFLQNSVSDLDNQNVIKDKALEEFDGLVKLLIENGVDPIVFADLELPYTPDSVFSNNWISLHQNGTAILYPMFAVNRRKERRMDVLEILQKDHSFLINNIHDPIYEWPLGSRDFINFIRSKYGSINDAKTKIHHYEHIIRPRVEATGTSDAKEKACITIDVDTYNTLDAVDRDTIYCFEWEVDENEKKRDIKMVDPRFAATIFGEHAEKYE